MNASLIYNPVSGHHLTNKKLEYIKNELSASFDIFLVKESKSHDDFISKVKESCEKDDVLIISGGDGSINMAINIVAKSERKPILGFIPLGTLNDSCRNLNLPKNYKKAVQVIKTQHVKAIDIIKINDYYASYVATFGAYSDLPYVVGNKEKKIFGRLAYYFHAVPRVFKSIKIKGKLVFEDKEVEFITPFMLLLNGRRMGGFPINKGAKNDDGVIDIIYSKPGIFNSLPRYFINRKSLNKYQVSKVRVELPSDTLWEIDGERGPLGSVDIEVKHHHLKIYARQ